MGFLTPREIEPAEIRKCKKCKLKALQIGHGFRDHNWRETCPKCGNINYEEYE